MSGETEKVAGIIPVVFALGIVEHQARHIEGKKSKKRKPKVSHKKKHLKKVS